MRQYFELYVAFNRLDVNYDQRISREEFRKAVEDKQLEQWKIIIDDVDAEFDSIDTNDGGKVMFDEVRMRRMRSNVLRARLRDTHATHLNYAIALCAVLPLGNQEEIGH
jgi:Ca2+-binding EF-hand superfamily protein